MYEVYEASGVVSVPLTPPIPPAPPPRPLIPATLYVLLAIIGVEYLLLSTNEAPVALPLICVVVIVLVVVGTHSIGKEIPWIVVVVLGAMCCAWLASALFLRIQEQAIAYLSSTSIANCEFITIGDASEGSYTWQVLAEAYVDDVYVGDVWLKSYEALDRGVTVSGIGRFSAYTTGDWAASMRRRGIYGSVQLSSITVQNPEVGLRGSVVRLRSFLLDIVDPMSSAERALLAGLVCGYTPAADEWGITDSFSICGAAHLVAVSGGHLTLVASAVSSILFRLKLSRGVSIIALILLTGLFVLFCGAPLSAVRSWIMCLVSYGAVFAGRREHALSSLCLVGCVMYVMRPKYVGDVGLALSIASLIGLTLLGEYAAYASSVVIGANKMHGTQTRLKKKFTRSIDSIAQTMSSCAVAQISTAPIVIPLFSRLSLIAPLANVVLTPILNLGIGAGMFSVLLCWVPHVGSILLALCDICLYPALICVEVCAAVPWASIVLTTPGWICWLVVISGILLVLVLWPTLTRKRMLRIVLPLILFVAVIFVRARYFAPARIVVLDVGQGDAILIQDGAYAVLVDTGPDDTLLEALAQEQVFHLDAVILTHMHDDHYGGVESLVGSVGVDQVFLGAGVVGNETDELKTAITKLVGDRVEEIAYGDTVHVGNFELTCLSPVEARDGSENEDSLVLEIVYEQHGTTLSGLLTGDAESDVLAAIELRDGLHDIDFLKVGHHGAEASITSQQAELLMPELSVASAGENNSYGHPTTTCVEVLQNVGSEFMCTIDYGNVEIVPAAYGVVVRTSNGM